MAKKIKFAVSGADLNTTLDYSDSPVPAKKHIPEWFKNTQTVKVANMEDSKRLNFKHCMPFTDAFLTGYILETPTDISIERVPGSNPKITFNEEQNVLSFRDKRNVGNIKIPDYCYDIHFIFKHTMHIKTPKGYSLLVTQPLNRLDLPFIALSGIVDTDVEPLRPGNYPVLLRKDFEGVIPKGTPILQIIPIKRESWQSEVDKSLLDTWMRYIYQVTSVFYGWYKNKAWVRKEYN
jgi:hypothetical protein